MAAPTGFVASSAASKGDRDERIEKDPRGLVPVLDGVSQARVQCAVDRLAAGRFVIVCDSAGLPNRGDLVIFAGDVSSAAMSFAVRYSSGFVQVALTESRCDELHIPIMQGTATYGPGQRVTVDVVEGTTTGISASDRACTARALASSKSTPSSFTRPGHVVPFCVDVPFGFPDTIERASLQLLALAGREPVAVTAQIVGSAPSVSMSHGSDLLNFARLHDLPVVGLDDLVGCRSA
ncbi:3,4-dihydroxy-2-butanone-4-phosphate synthase [Rhodococcus sp. ACS1]|uniref:3,4-dihydroxy-2-butanone-4-phosphate synthase n=1 Tax=Rhodococcus sp. ACS1 TaxID=2028570 RepID=UPI0015C9F5B0|nr:3,4-dihydroxy-2-butanone-4-phosphate synthase [Rhodococcus sp. ACS1]